LRQTAQKIVGDFFAGTASLRFGILSPHMADSRIRGFHAGFRSGRGLAFRFHIASIAELIQPD
jgi:hypothetical protein